MDLGGNHWNQWREDVQRTGYTDALKKASYALEILDSLNVEQVEAIFRNNNHKNTEVEM